MDATTYDPTAQYGPPTQSPHTNHLLPTTQTTESISTIQSISTTQDPSTTPKSPTYIVITGLGKSCVALKTHISTYPKLISYIRTSFPGTYHKSHFRKIALPISVQTRDLPVSKGSLVDVQPDVWATMVADIDNIEIGIAKSKA
ncbi:hypothetical protein F5146DRAFT_1228857 [Armillaria mellea]|nr:hypothetical protein F5146DRAFT_1228857 [Armillaria mellea]